TARRADCPGRAPRAHGPDARRRATTRPPRRFSRGGTYHHSARRSPTRPQDEQRRAAEHLIVDMPGMPSILLLLAGRAAARHIHMDIRWLTGANAAPVPAAETKRPRSEWTRAANPYRCLPVVPSVVSSSEFSVGIVYNP